LTLGGREEGAGIVSAGRTFRDYATLLAAFRALELPLTVVASSRGTAGLTLPPNVSARYDLPFQELLALLASSSIVVLPLDERQISTGQSVLLHAMAMGKPVIASRVTGTLDYVEHLRTGLLVPPGDPDALRSAVVMLAASRDLRVRLGTAAQQQVRSRHLPSHYARNLSRLLRGGSPMLGSVKVI
jgi:glycosyltransferase involved in cell wall biosynthesis